MSRDEQLSPRNINQHSESSSRFFSFSSLHPPSLGYHPMSASATTQNPENSEAPFLQSDPSSSLNTSSPDPNPSTTSSSTLASQLPVQNRTESVPTALSPVANEGEQQESSQELDKGSELMKDSAAGPSITKIEQSGCTDTEEAESLARGLAGLTLPESRGESGASESFSLSLSPSSLEVSHSHP